MNNRKFNEMVTKVCVVKSKLDSYWYADKIGESFGVVKVGDFGGYVVNKDGGTERYHIQIEDCEPVEIRYNNERYRLESRKAEVGEKIVVVDWDSDHPCNDVEISEIFTVKYVSVSGFIYAVKEREIGANIRLNEYRVLVPVKSAASALTANVNVKLCEDTTKIIDMLTSLSTKVTELERTNDKLSAYIRDLNGKIIELDRDVDEIKERMGNAKSVTQAPKQLTRADVVAKAQADIIWLQAVTENDRPVYRLPIARLCTAEFIVNREKRTVVVLLRREIRKSEVVSKGIAKCAPGDVFNESIGKAIALRRALGLAVPSEYTDAPKPEGVAVGDVVNGKYKQGVDFYSEDRRFTLTSYNAYKACFYYAEDGSDYIYANQIGQVIDDSDREEYRKGVRC